MKVMVVVFVGWRGCLEPDFSSALFVKGLKVLIDDGDSEEDTSTRTNGAHKVGSDSQSTNAHATKSRSCRNVLVQKLFK